MSNGIGSSIGAISTVITACAFVCGVGLADEDGHAAGMAAANGRLYISLKNGKVICFGKDEAK